MSRYIVASKTVIALFTKTAVVLYFLLATTVVSYAMQPLQYNCYVMWNKIGHAKKKVPNDIILPKWKKKFQLKDIYISSEGIGFTLKFPKKYKFKRLRTAIDFSPFFANSRRFFLNCKESSLYDCISDKTSLINILKKYDSKTYKAVNEFYNEIKEKFPNWNIKYDGKLLITFEADYHKIKSEDEAISNLNAMNKVLKNYVYGAHIPSFYNNEESTEFEVFYVDKTLIVPEYIKNYDYGKTVVSLLKKLVKNGIINISKEDLLAIKKAAGSGRTIFYRARGCPYIPNVVITKNKTGWIAVKNNCRVKICPACPQCPKIECYR